MPAACGICCFPLHVCVLSHVLSPQPSRCQACWSYLSGFVRWTGARVSLVTWCPAANLCLWRKGSGSQWVTGSSNATPSYRAQQLLLCPAALWGFQGGLGHSKLCHIRHPMPCSAKTSHTTLTSRPIPLQGIERLQRKTQPREHSGSWKSVQEAFGGDFSLNWFNPFTRPCQPVIPIDKGLVRQVSSLSDMDNMETTESQLEETKDRDSVEVLDE